MNLVSYAQIAFKKLIFQAGLANAITTAHAHLASLASGFYRNWRFNGRCADAMTLPISDGYLEGRTIPQYSVPPGFWDSAIAEFITKSSKLRHFRKRLQIFIIAANFSQILGLDAYRDIITMHIQSKKGCFSVTKAE